MFNPTVERERVYNLLSQASVENQHLSKKELFDESIVFALSEYMELAKHYDDFFKAVDHLVIYNHMLKENVLKDTINMMRELKHLIEKNYEKDELEKMPPSVYDQVLHSQKERADLLKKVAETYLRNRVKNSG